MTPETCPHCGAKKSSGGFYACGSAVGAPYRSVDCWVAEADNLRARVIDAERQLSDALARVAVLEEADRSNNASIGMFRARVRELEGRVARLVAAGDLAVQFCAPSWLDSDSKMDLKNRASHAWAKAKEAKP